MLILSILVLVSDISDGTRYRRTEIAPAGRLFPFLYTLYLSHCQSPTCGSTISIPFQSIHDTDLLFSPPLFAKLDATLMDPKLLQEKLGVQDFPTLLTITGTQHDAMIRDWFGSIETADQLYDTIRHYWYRWNEVNAKRRSTSCAQRVRVLSSKPWCRCTANDTTRTGSQFILARNFSLGMVTLGYSRCLHSLYYMWW